MQRNHDLLEKLLIQEKVQKVSIYENIRTVEDKIKKILFTHVLRFDAIDL